VTRHSLTPRVSARTPNPPRRAPGVSRVAKVGTAFSPYHSLHQTEPRPQHAPSASLRLCEKPHPSGFISGHSQRKAVTE
jgi:hypothetical protein